MTIHRDGGEFVATCARCPETVTATDMGLERDAQFGVFWEALQLEGWVSFLTGEKMKDGSRVFDHMCKDCADD